MKRFDDPDIQGYAFEAGSGSEFKQADLERIELLVRSRDQVGGGALHKHLPDALCIAVARDGGEIVSVAVLKANRPGYNQQIAMKSAGARLEDDDLEFGYVATNSAHEQRGLGGRVSSIALEYSGRIYATARTDNATIREMLTRRGFQEEGKPWHSNRGTYALSLWVRHC
jgi:hypothetical protein